MGTQAEEQSPAPGAGAAPVGASLLAKTVQATRSSRMPALSLTTFASKLAPTGFSGVVGGQVQAHLFHRRMGTQAEEQSPAPGAGAAPVGASLLAKTVQATRSSRMPALSLTTFASKLAPTGFSGVVGGQVQAHLFHRLMGTQAEEQSPAPGAGAVPVGASLLAKNVQATRSSRMPALSLTIFASKLAPTVGR
ncbi:hypothetical protein C1Y28_24395 [Pseudomonas sp. GW704-F5]|nr:hypothetical protein C1Y28_24395 [Pseudomonas sp. GW704-F5]